MSACRRSWRRTRCGGPAARRSAPRRRRPRRACGSTCCCVRSRRWRGRGRPSRTGRPVLDRDHLPGDRSALHVRVEERQEDADPRHRGVGQAELGRWGGVVDQGDPAVGRRDDHTRAGWRHPRRVPEEQRARARGGQAGGAQPRGDGGRQRPTRARRRRTVDRPDASAERSIGPAQSAVGLRIRGRATGGRAGLAIGPGFYGSLADRQVPHQHLRTRGAPRRRLRRSPADSSPTPASAGDATPAGRSW